jgi:histone-lysine N-methyltransferase SETMAR
VVPHIQRNSRQKSSFKVLASVFWDRDGILLVDYLEKGATITERTGLQTSRQAFERNLVLKDNASLQKVAIMQQKLADLHFRVQKQPAYSPDIAPSDYRLFPSLRKHLSIEEVSLAADWWFA